MGRLAALAAGAVAMAVTARCLLTTLRAPAVATAAMGLGSSKLDLEALNASPLPPREAVNDFAFHLFRLISEDEDNTFFSPLSLYVTLGMVAAGTSPDGDAEMQLGGLLRTHFHDRKQLEGALEAVKKATNKGANVDYVLANSIWTRAAIRPDYAAAITKDFDARCDHLSTPEAINQWVSDSTQNKITQLIEKIEPNCVCILASAIYFKASWTNQFKPADTKPGHFLVDDTRIDCKMMSMSHKLPFGTDDKHFKMVCLPYGEEQKTSMAIIMPVKEGSGALHDLLSAFTNEHWVNWLRKLQPAMVHMKMPRFKMESSMSIAKQLNALGVTAPFQPDHFSRMSDSPDVYLDDVLHKAVVEVNEEGTVAAAASAAVMLERSMPMKSVEFTVDRPFIMAIIDNESLMITFMGKIANPEFM
eukprot:m.285614 g.285614  ORF g.285614 m.285614 type:complete len:417 (+) comp11415_c0_seq1:122-1372(+)